MKNKNKKTNRKHTVTAGIILSVTAVIICVAILVGGIGSETDITDIFIGDDYEENTPDNGTVIKSYSSTGVIATFEENGDGDIILTYSSGMEHAKKLKFTFDDNDRITSAEREIGENVFVPIAEYTYSDTSLVSLKRFSRKGETAEFTFNSKENRDGSGTSEIRRLDSEGSVLYSEFNQWNRNGDFTLYKLFDENEEQISGYQKSYSRDSYGNITEIVTTPFGSDEMKTVYRYDEKGSVIYAAVYKKDLITAVTTYSYVYNIDGRPESKSETTEFTDSGITQQINTVYAYDENGNMISKTVTDAAQDILLTGSYEYENGYMTVSNETDSIAGTNTTYVYEYASGSYYAKMKATERIWDIQGECLSDNSLLFR